MFSQNNNRVRMLEEEDLSFIKDIRLNESTADNLGTLLFTNNLCQQKWFEKISATSSEMFLIFEVKNEHGLWEKIGYIRFSDIDRINSSICVGADVHMDQRGKGYGTIIYKLIFSLCFEQWNMNRVWLLAIDYNKIALSLYHKIGFVEEGVQRKAIFRNGNYHDYIMMSILKDEYNERANTTF